jgi:DNA-directed RNA polymerase specialized sigma24 family protein
LVGYPAEGVAALFRQHHGELVRLAVLMVGDQPTAEDAVQDAYAGMHARRSQLADKADPLPYIRTAVLNGCRSVLRRRGVARRVGVLYRASSPPGNQASAEQAARSWCCATTLACPRRRSPPCSASAPAP